jgi:hypothetical protein
MRLKKGDIFIFAVNDKGYAVGQIISIPNKQSLTVVIFKAIIDKIPDSNFETLISSSTPLLFGNTFDAKFYHKHWTVIANYQDNLTKYQLPFYKIGITPSYIEDFNGKKIRKCTPLEEEKLIYRKYIAPIRFENALLAYNGLGEWNDELYNQLLYSYNIFSYELVYKV